VTTVLADRNWDPDGGLHTASSGAVRVERGHQ